MRVLEYIFLHTRQMAILPSGLLIIVFLMAYPAQGGQIVVNSLPYTIYASNHSGDAIDTITLAGTRLSSGTSGLKIQSEWDDPACNFYIDLGTDTISFGESGGSGNRGLQLSGTSSYYPHDITVNGGYIIHNTSNTSADNNICISISGHDLLFKDVNCIIKGTNGKCVSGGGAGNYNIEFDGGRYRSDVTSFTSRCNYDAAVFFLANCYAEAVNETDADYHYIIHHVVVENGPHVALYLAGRETTEHHCVSKIYACSLQTDAINEMYTSYSGTCHSSSNPYGISLRRTGPGTDVFANVITSGTERGGNRGILIEYASGTADKRVKIHHNYIDVHEGPNVEYGDNLPVHGIRIRYSPRYLHVYDNTFICTGDNLTSTTAYGMHVHTFRYSWKITNTNNIFERNHIIAKSNTSGVHAAAITMEGGGIAAPPHDQTLVVRNNRIESNNILVKWGDINGGGPGTNMFGDTLRFLATTYNPETFHLGHYGNNWDCGGNKVCDIVYENGASDDDINMSTNGLLELTLQRQLVVTAMGNNDEPVSGATVTAVNGYGQTILNGTTGGNGTYSGRVSYKWVSRTASDSTAFNNFTVKVKKANDSTITAHTVTASSVIPTMILENTTGEQEDDSIPPAPIDDLDASSGFNLGEIFIGWTAPGDDGTTGTADSYEIRYSIDLITDVNWNDATVFGSSPTPLVAGNTQTQIIPGLSQGEMYYVGIKTYDDASNVSELSNIDSAVAMWSIILDVDDQVQIAGPASGSILKTTRPSLSVLNIEEQNIDYYSFEVANDSSFVNAITSDLVARQEGSTTSWKVNEKLQSEYLYYWRVRADNLEYSDIYSFTIQSETHVYPNPFNMAVASSAIFTNIPPGSELCLMTVSGQEIRQWRSDTGEDIEWNGTNESGNPVASDTYLWYISGTSNRGKIVVIR